MNAPVKSRSVLVLLCDETGPLCSFHSSTDRLPADKMKVIELGSAIWLKYDLSTVLSVEWAKDPSMYTSVGDQVLVVTIPGTHEVYVSKPKVRAPRPRAKRPEHFEFEDPLDWRGDLGLRGVIARMAVSAEVARTSAPEVAPARAPLDAVEVVNTCTTCGTAYTAATWARLQIAGAKDIREGSTMIHEDYRHCTCGSTRMIFSTRIVGEEP